MICHKCVVLDHYDHIDRIKEIRREDLEAFTHKSIAVLDEEREVIAGLRSIFSQFISKETSLNSKRFIKAIE